MANQFVVDRLFGKVFDVEHIQSYQDKNEAERDRIKAAWGDELNAIGNLVAMESSINRSMHNDVYSDKLLAYRHSEFPSIAKLMTAYPAWGLGFARDRKVVEIEKIVSYIFNSK